MLQGAQGHLLDILFFTCVGRNYHLKYKALPHIIDIIDYFIPSNIGYPLP